MLPFRADCLQAQSIAFEEDYPPLLIRLSFPSEFDYLVPLVTSVVLNTCLQSATKSAARTFVFNAVGSNNYNNRYLTEIVELVVKVLTISMRKGLYNSPEIGVRDSVNHALLLYMALIIYEYPDLKSMLDHKVLDAAAQNYHLYQNQMNEYETIKERSVNYPAQQQQSRYPAPRGEPTVAYPQTSQYDRGGAYQQPVAPDPRYQRVEPPYAPMDPRLDPRSPYYDQRYAQQYAYDPRMDPRSPYYVGPAQQYQDPRYQQASYPAAPIDPRFTDPRSPYYDPRYAAPQQRPWNEPPQRGIDPRAVGGFGGGGPVTQPRYDNSGGGQAMLSDRYNHRPGNQAVQQQPQPQQQPQYEAPPYQASRFQQAARPAPQQPEMVFVDLPDATPTYQEPVKENTMTEELTAEDWLPTVEQPHRALRVRKIHAPIFIKRKSKRSNETIVVEEVTTMDRAAHSTSTVLAGDYPLNTGRRSEQVEEAVKELASITVTEIKKANVDPVAAEEIGVHVDVVNGVFSNLDAAVFNSKREMFRINKLKKTCSVYRSYATVAEPFVGSDNHSEILDKLSECKTFADLAHKLKAGFNALSSLAVEERGMLYEVDHIALYYNAINERVTGIVNDFFTNKLSIKLTMSSFMDDQGDVANHLENVYGEHYSAGWKRFESNLLKGNMFYLSPEELITLSALYEAEDGMDFSYIPLTYSFTQTDLTSKELDYDLKEGESLMIRESLTPSLYKIVTSLFEHNSTLETKPVYNLLITADGKRYKLHRGYVGMDCFLISL